MVNKKRPKHNFFVSDVTRVLVALWVKEDLVAASHHLHSSHLRSAFPLDLSPEALLTEYARSYRLCNSFKSSWH